MLFAVDFPVNRQSLVVVLAGRGVVAGGLEERTKVVQRRGSVGVLVAMHLPQYRQRPLEIRPRGGVVARVLQQRAQVVQPGGRYRVLFPQYFPTDGHKLSRDRRRFLASPGLLQFREPGYKFEGSLLLQSLHLFRSQLLSWRSLRLLDRYIAPMNPAVFVLSVPLEVDAVPLAVHFTHPEPLALLHLSQHGGAAFDLSRG